MIKRTLYFGNRAYLSLENRQMVISKLDDVTTPQYSIPKWKYNLMDLSFRRLIQRHMVVILFSGNLKKHPVVVNGREVKAADCYTERFVIKTDIKTLKCKDLSYLPLTTQLCA